MTDFIFKIDSNLKLEITALNFRIDLHKFIVL